MSLVWARQFALIYEGKIEELNGGPEGAFLVHRKLIAISYNKWNVYYNCLEIYYNIRWGTSKHTAKCLYYLAIFTNTRKCLYLLCAFCVSASRIRYEITSGNIGGAFAVKNMTGAIYVAGALDYETRKRVSGNNLVKCGYRSASEMAKTKMYRELLQKC